MLHQLIRTAAATPTVCRSAATLGCKRGRPDSEGSSRRSDLSSVKPARGSARRSTGPSTLLGPLRGKYGNLCNASPFASRDPGVLCPSLDACKNVCHATCHLPYPDGLLLMSTILLHACTVQVEIWYSGTLSQPSRWHSELIGRAERLPITPRCVNVKQAGEPVERQ